jgi:SAM-dependent methyltransferase
MILRGPLETATLLRGEKTREQKLGINTMVFKRSRTPSNYHYQGASYKVLDKIFKELKNLAASHQFFDVGCGRGRVLVMAAEAGFKNVVGVEIDPELVRDAEENLKRYSSSSKVNLPLILNGDARSIKYPDKPTVYFFFNPFSEVILSEVLTKILRQGAADNYFVYMNPRHKHVFEKLGFIVIKRLRTGFYTEALIYHTS